MKTLIKLPEVVRRTAQSKAKIYKQMKLGTFPHPVKIGRRAVAWLEEEIEAHIAGRITARDDQKANQ
jgi:prophage regulatory protein